MGLMAEKDGWQISDSLWEKIQPLLPVPLPKPHPLGCHRPRVDERLAMNAILFVLRMGASGMRCMPLGSVPAAAPTAGFWSGLKRASLSDAGVKACSSTMNSKGLIGRGCPWMAP